jgi:hypothetical protein
MMAPPEVVQAAGNWVSLSRWDRAELGRRLRRSGWTYGEIMEILPVGKGTLAGWCKEIRLSEEQIDAIKARVPSQVGVPKDTQRRRRSELENIRSDARASFPSFCKDPLWVAGLTMYWAEGAKTSNRLAMANTDPRVLALFIRWIRTFHDPDAEFVLTLHLHTGNDDEAAKQWWADTLNLEGADFYKTFVKPPGTGHRKNRWVRGVCRVQMRRSADACNRTMEWIDCLAEELTEAPTDTLAKGR